MNIININLNSKIIKFHNISCNFSINDIINEIDEHIIGQKSAKKSLLISIKNHFRKNKVKNELKNVIKLPNILMIGATGVGKTELLNQIIRTLDISAKKVNATDFTTKGYQGLDVDFIIHDFVESEIAKMKTNLNEKNKKKNLENSFKIIKDLIKKQKKDLYNDFNLKDFKGKKYDEILLFFNMDTIENDNYHDTQILINNFNQLLNDSFSNKKKYSIKKIKEMLIDEEGNSDLSEDIIKEKINYIENYGIIFIDEIDKIVEKRDQKTEVNREGVQRDLLSIIDGTVIYTKYGKVNTKNMLFIAAGAFHLSKPEELIPELQGRLSSIINLNPLNKQNIKDIITKKKFNIIEQYKALFAIDGVKIEFEKNAIDAIVEIIDFLNTEYDNIGMRRIPAVFEKITESLYDENQKNVIITEDFVKKKISYLYKRYNISKFIL